MASSSLIFEIIGVDRASRTFDKVGRSVSQTSTKLQSMQKFGAAAGRALGVGLLAAGYGAVKATQAAAEDEAAQAQLAQQLKKAAGASDEQVAATEKWITAQGLAKGVADDELRPAMARLATATGDVDKAQRLATLAMSVSAGTGKSLEQVTTALAKAQNGNIGGLGRLGIATKDAAGHTKTLAQITQDLSNKYKGSAAAAAETTAGKQKILSVQMHELQEQIGTALIPAMTKLAEVGLKVVNWISNNTTTVGYLLVAFGALLAITWAVGVATKLWATYQALSAAATVIWTNAQWALNIALTANPIGLVIAAIAALVVGIVIAYKHSETFRNIVDKTFSFIGRVVPQVIGAVVSFVKAHWGLLVSIIGGPVAIVAVQVIKHFDTIKSKVGSVVSFVVGKAKDFGKFAAAAKEHFGDVVDFVKKIPGKIKGFFADLPDELRSIGVAIVSGLAHGISAAAHWVYDAVTRIISNIPGPIRKMLGINSPAKAMIPLGEAIPEGLALGIERKTSVAVDAAKKAAEKVKAQLQTLQQNFASTSSSVAGNFTGNLFSASAQAAVLDEAGNVITPAQTVGQNFLGNLSSTSSSLKALIPAFKQLRKWGWKPSMLAMLFQSGGPDLILELASDKGEASTAAGLLGGIGHASNQLGNLVADNQYGDKIHKLKGGKGGGKGDGGSERTAGDTYNVTVVGSLDGNDAAKKVVQAIKRYKREVEGNRTLGIA